MNNLIFYLLTLALKLKQNHVVQQNEFKNLFSSTMLAVNIYRIDNLITMCKIWHTSFHQALILQKNDATFSNAFNCAGVLQASTSSAAKIYIDLDIPENKNIHERYHTIQSYMTIIPSIFHNNKKTFS
jgi:hypothetical protein